MKNLKAFILKTITLSLFVLCLLTLLVCAQDNNELQLYNRNEKVQLSKSLIHKNDDYYISVDDLSKINIQYKFTESDDGFEFSLFSNDAFGTENQLRIDATSEELLGWDDNVGAFVSVKAYSFSNVIKSKKSRLLNSTGTQVVTTNIGDFNSAIIADGNYYISIQAISIAISYEYSVSDNIIKLWITDTNHHMINGEISLPDGETAPEEGINVNILALNGEGELTDNYSFKRVCIPEGENKTYYFIETDISDYYNWLMFEFDGNYKTINEFINTQNGSKLNITTSQTEKISFDINVSMPGNLVADDDLYSTIIFQQCSVYKSVKPIIKKGDRCGTVTLNIDKVFVGEVAFTDILGDNRLFAYGYYGYGDLTPLNDSARIVVADYGEISATFLQCYEISGQVIPTDINSGYTVRVFGFTNSNEKIYISEKVGDDFKFNVKIPASVPEYTLSVAYRPGVYCNYVSDGVSTYSRKYHTFENICDYSEIRLKYEPFLPDLPIDMNASANTGWVDLKNLSDDLVQDFTLYCAHYRDGKLIYLSSTPIDRLMVYSDYESYKAKYPTEFYKTDEVRFFVWDNSLKPLSISITKKVNEPYYPDDMEFYDVDLSSEYYTAVKSMHLAGVILGYDDGMFRPDNYVMRNEAAAMFCRMLGYWCNTYKFSCDDVAISNWESSYVGICVNENIFELTDNKFRPEENITVKEVYEAIQNLLEKENLEINSADLLTNINYENSERDITRAEFAQMLYNYKYSLINR